MPFTPLKCLDYYDQLNKTLFIEKDILRLTIPSNKDTLATREAFKDLAQAMKIPYEVIPSKTTETISFKISDSVTFAQFIYSASLRQIGDSQTWTTDIVRNASTNTTSLTRLYCQKKMPGSSIEEVEQSAETPLRIAFGLKDLDLKNPLFDLKEAMGADGLNISVGLPLEETLSSYLKALGREHKSTVEETHKELTFTFNTLQELTAFAFKANLFYVPDFLEPQWANNIICDAASHAIILARTAKHSHGHQSDEIPLHSIFGITYTPSAVLTQPSQTQLPSLDERSLVRPK